MYVDPFWFGVCVTIGVELVLVIIGSVISGGKR